MKALSTSHPLKGQRMLSNKLDKILEKAVVKSSFSHSCWDHSENTRIEIYENTKSLNTFNETDDKQVLRSESENQLLKNLDELLG